ncbi:MAG: hypothetical protein MK186_06705 [Henriciella sp.]|nr:hypothetical protein [Henriciella sp.]
MKLVILSALAGLALTLPVARAQEGRQQTVTVTASQIDVDDLRSAPAIYSVIPADFLLVEVNFQSGSRDAEEREQELKTSYDRLIAKAAATNGFELSGGDIGETSAPIESVKFTDVFSLYGNKASFTLTLSIDVAADETFDDVMARAKDFLDSVRPEGRAEAYLGSEQFIGARNMGTRRDALLADIIASVEQLQSQMGAGRVTVSGLESRVVTQPSGPLELEIFIPYEMSSEWTSAN